MKTRIAILTSFLLLGYTGYSCADDGFTQKDRELLIELKVKVAEIDKRFEQIDKRFEQIDKRLEFMQNLMIGMLGVFGGLCGVFVGLLLWDRRTFKEKAKEEAVKAVEEGRLKDVLTALREYADMEPRLKEVLKRFKLS